MHNKNDNNFYFYNNMFRFIDDTVVIDIMNKTTEHRIS